MGKVYTGFIHLEGRDAGEQLHKDFPPRRKVDVHSTSNNY